MAYKKYSLNFFSGSFSSIVSLKHRPGPRALVGELREVLCVAPLLPLGDQVAALVVRRGQLHALAGELGVKVP